MNAREASEYTKRVDPERKGLSIAYLGRIAREGRIQGARKIVDGPVPVPYWWFDQAGLDEYLSRRRTPSRRP